MKSQEERMREFLEFCNETSFATSRAHCSRLDEKGVRDRWRKHLSVARSRQSETASSGEMS